MLSFHPPLNLTNSIFPSGFLAIILYAFLISHMRATCPACLILLDFVIIPTRTKGFIETENGNRNTEATYVGAPVLSALLCT
jgi:hypothetical protein